MNRTLYRPFDLLFCKYLAILDWKEWNVMTMLRQSTKHAVVSVNTRFIVSFLYCKLLSTCFELIDRQPMECYHWYTTKRHDGFFPPSSGLGTLISMTSYIHWVWSGEHSECGSWKFRIVTIVDNLEWTSRIQCSRKSSGVVERPPLPPCHGILYSVTPPRVPNTQKHNQGERPPIVISRTTLLMIIQSRFDVNQHIFGP